MAFWSSFAPWAFISSLYFGGRPELSVFPNNWLVVFAHALHPVHLERSSFSGWSYLPFLHCPALPIFLHFVGLHHDTSSGIPARGGSGQFHVPAWLTPLDGVSGNPSVQRSLSFHVSKPPFRSFVRFSTSSPSMVLVQDGLCMM